SDLQLRQSVRWILPITKILLRQLETVGRSDIATDYEDGVVRPVVRRVDFCDVVPLDARHRFRRARQRVSIWRVAIDDAPRDESRNRTSGSQRAAQTIQCLSPQAFYLFILKTRITY